MYFSRIEHIENYSFEKLQSLTTVIAIKCKDGIIMASDSQGTALKYKLQQKKIYKINEGIALGGAGDSSQIRYVVDRISKSLDSILDPNLLEQKLNETFEYIHKIKNNDKCFNAGYYLQTLLPFSPEILLIARTKEDDFYIYHGGFGELGKDKVKISDVSIVNESYEVIGSGKELTYLILNQLSRIYKNENKNLVELDSDLVIGLLIYIMDEIKNLDSYSGGVTNIILINKEEYREIPLNEHQKYYNIMIDSLSSIFSKNQKEVLRKIFPARTTTFL